MTTHLRGAIHGNSKDISGKQETRNEKKFFEDILAAFEKEQDSLNFLNFLNNKHPNIKFTIEKQVNHFHRFP